MRTLLIAGSLLVCSVAWGDAGQVDALDCVVTPSVQIDLASAVLTAARSMLALRTGPVANSFHPIPFSSLSGAR